MMKHYKESIRQSTADEVKNFLDKHNAKTLEDIPTPIILEEMQDVLENLDAEIFMVDCRKDYLQVLTRAIEVH